MVVNPPSPINPGLGRPLDSYFPLTYRRPKPGSLSIQGLIYNPSMYRKLMVIVYMTIYLPFLQNVSTTVYFTFLQYVSTAIFYSFFICYNDQM